jgi:hypothetical protein
MRAVRLGAVLAVLTALAVALADHETAPAQEASGVPLTKEQYQERVIELSPLSGRLNVLDARMSIRELPKPRCAAKLKSFHRLLMRLTREAEAVVPPPEIAGLHRRLANEGRRMGRGVRKLRGSVAAGRLVCGFERNPNVSQKLHDLYYAGPLDATINELFEREYFPGGN